MWNVDLGGIFLDNETFQFQLIVMLGAHCLTPTPGMNNSNHYKTHSQDTLHVDFTYDYHQVYHSLSISFQQSYSDDCKFFDGIKFWLEESYISSCIISHNTIKLNFLSEDLWAILPIFHPSLLHSLQLAFNEHAVVGFELLDWMHWHYDFT